MKYSMNDLFVIVPNPEHLSELIINPQFRMYFTFKKPNWFWCKMIYLITGWEYKNLHQEDTHDRFMG